MHYLKKIADLGAEGNFLLTVAGNIRRIAVEEKWACVPRRVMVVRF
jgi:hypothetical protein